MTYKLIANGCCCTPAPSVINAVLYAVSLMRFRKIISVSRNHSCAGYTLWGFPGYRQ
jgi:hypothetical protein